jgi:hypothetical protein
MRVCVSPPLASNVSEVGCHSRSVTSPPCPLQTWCMVHGVWCMAYGVGGDGKEGTRKEENKEKGEEEEEEQQQQQQQHSSSTCRQRIIRSSKILIRWSLDAVASQLPLTGFHATLFTLSLCSCRVFNSLPAFGSHRRMELSLLPLAMRPFSGCQATLIA